MVRLQAVTKSKSVRMRKEFASERFCFLILSSGLQMNAGRERKAHLPMF
jgi:hypothetical protein